MAPFSDSSLVAPLLSLPLDPISPRLPIGEPFTPSMAARAGIGRAVLERLHREGRVRRLLRGVYLDGTVRSTLAVRAQALALVVASRHVVVGRTAAWLHGVDVPETAERLGADLPPIEVHGRGRQLGRPVRFADHDVQTVGGIRCTTPLRTALDLGRQLSPERALAALDGLLRLGSFSHTALMAQLPRFGGQHGVVQLRDLAALADARAACAAESVLRLRWLDGRLPTPAPGLVVAGSRLALGLEVQRFGASLVGQLGDADLASLSDRGWHVVVIGQDRVLHSDPGFLVGHLEREFHLRLLEEVG